MRIITINLNGIRAASRKGFFEWMAQQQADFICLQELKAQQNNLTDTMISPEGYHSAFHYAEKKGYSGVGIYSRQQPDRVIEGLGDAEFDREGRYIQADFGNLSVISLYLPSGTSGDIRQQVKFKFLDLFRHQLDQLQHSGQHIIICGDWNIAHQKIDLKNWRSNQKNSGFLPEERDWMTRLFDETDYIDVFRRLYPEQATYTWWSNRGQAWANNTGWRIDYQIATSTLGQQAHQADVYREQRFSDHAPLTIDYHWPDQKPPSASS